MFPFPRPTQSQSARHPHQHAPPLFESLESRWHLAADFVIHVSVDGLRPDAITQLGQSQLPNLFRMRTEGSFTDNARTDYDYTITLPNHTDMVTGRPVVGTGGIVGHNWTTNSDPAANQTLHSNRGAYVPSAWDVVHDNGQRTALYASKTKFSLYDASYDADATSLQGGAPDVTGVDNGRDKIDTYLYSGDSGALTDSFVTAMNANPFHYSMVHYHEPDTAGHANGWMTTAYFNALRLVDTQVGKLLNLVATNPALTGRTTIILTADHGGTGTGHGTASDRLNYTIPFYTWGSGVDASGNLYAMNGATRLDPGTGRPTYSVTQPIRNGDVANLALDLLDLPPVAGSFFNAAQNLSLTAAAGQPAVVNIASVANAAEPATNGRFRVTRAGGDASAALTVQYAVSGTATNGADYQTLTGTVTIPANATEALFSVTPIDDTLSEGSESVIATLSADAAYTVGSAGAATVTIADDDAAPAAPTNLAGRAASRTQVNLTWTDNASNEDGFRIEYSTDGVNWIEHGTAAANATSYAVTGLSPNTMYHFRVRAYDDLLGNSAYSNVVKARTKK